jgi:2-dehydro-3-deoxyphosphogluconate aldolase/(4S)-4-hydroxy-2-oxoglutarate aldolase
MDRLQLLNKINESGAVAIIRMADSARLMKVAEAINKGGVSAIEVTMTTPNALKVIEDIAKNMGDTILIGVGSVLDSETARMAINAGAEFVVSPVFKKEIIETAHRYDKAAMPGCFTPTEILTAWEAGADTIKVFPADILGMAFFKAVLAPMPQLKLMPTGGVSLDNAGDWLKVGACAVGIGSALLDKKAIEQGDYKKLTENAQRMCASIAAAK